MNMTGLEDHSWKHILIVIILEILFLLFSIIFMGHGLKEWKKRKQVQYLFTIGAGFLMACMSLYVTKLLFNF